MTEDKTVEYAAKLYAHIMDIFDEESEYYIPIKEFSENDNITVFFHALSNIVPCKIYTTLTKKEKDLLGFNHLANRILFQFLKNED
ncbi:hypothetical protein [Paenimyroides ceti]